MNILVNTHILIWHFTGSPRASAQARLLIDSPENSVFYSIATPWEMMAKQQAHPESLPVDVSSLLELCADYSIMPLPLEAKHVLYLNQLEYRAQSQHHDPFDRIMLCQAAVEGMLFLTHDKALSAYGLANVMVV